MRTLTQPLNMSPGGIPPVIHVSQYDSDFTIVFTLFSTVGDFTIESGTTAMVRGTKSSGTGYSADAAINISAKTVTVTGNQQMTAAAGQNVFEITLLKSGKEISSKNFILLCERAALDADTITDESVLKELNAIIEGAETATQAAEEAEDAADRAEAAAQSLVIDSTPTQGSKNAVSSGGVYSALQAVEAKIPDVDDTLTDDIRDALLACFRSVVWTTEGGQQLYQALYDALYPIISISAVFTQGTAKIYTTDSLDALKQYLTVTVTYYGGAESVTTDYALSGVLEEGTSTITVTYRGKTATFNVNVTDEGVLYNLSSPLVLDGTTASDAIKTDVYLAASDFDFSIMVEFTNDDAPAWRMLLYCMDGKTPYPGYSLTVTEDRQYRFMDNKAEYWFPKSSNTTDIIRLVYTHKKDDGDCNAYLSINGTKKSRTNYISRTITTTVNLPLGIGCSINSRGNKGDIWKGTISVAKIFSRICTTNEIDDFLQNGVVV